jgi:hypothetical protein
VWGAVNASSPDELGSVTVYPYGRGFRWFVLAGSAGFFAGCVVVLVDWIGGADSSGVFWWLVAFLIWATGLVFFGAGVVFALALLIHPKPLLRFDRAGVESAEGSAHWSEVRRVIEVERTGEQGVFASLLFVLRPGTIPQPPPSQYEQWGQKRLRRWASSLSDRHSLRPIRDWIHAKYRLPPLESPVLEVSIWRCRSKALEALHHFYPEPVPTVPLEELETEISQGTSR